MRALLLCLGLTLAPAALAAEAALLLGPGPAAAAPAIAALGYRVTAAAEPDAAALAAAADRFLAEARGAARLVVALEGRFATDGETSWLLPHAGGEPGLLSVGRTGLPIDGLLRLLAEHPGRALMVVGRDAAAEGRAFDPWLREGVALRPAAGVAVLDGEAGAAAALLAAAAAEPGTDISALLPAAGLRPVGEPPQPFALVPAARATEAEAALWQEARARATLEAYRAYLEAHPDGVWAEAARAAMAAILADPDRAARLAEEALGLDAAARRDVQRWLSALDFDPRGVDGIWGPRTRAAIVNWQQQNGFPQTGYLDAEQLARLEAQAARAGAAAAAEAERARLALEALDRAFWEETGARGDEAGLRAYLERHPDGLFAESAADQLALVEEARRAAEARDDDAWAEALALATASGFDAYLRRFPEGRHAAAARERLAALAALAEGERMAAAAEEEEVALGLDRPLAQGIERRLAALGLVPGPADGHIDEATRGALRAFQAAQGLPATGWVDGATLLRLLTAAAAGAAGAAGIGDGGSAAPIPPARGGRL
jgi:peptidoglycan hydrolase-like protein with peptidoglycan-binding domain